MDGDGILRWCEGYADTETKGVQCRKRDTRYWWVSYRAQSPERKLLFLSVNTVQWLQDMVARCWEKLLTGLQVNEVTPTNHCFYLSGLDKDPGLKA